MGGYSQGATIALFTALTGGVVVDGLAIVKGWVARSDTIRQVSIDRLTRNRDLMVGTERWLPVHSGLLGSREG